MPRPAVFLDRDGVLTIPDFRDGRSFAPLTLETFRFYPDAAASVLQLKSRGFLTIVVTNQPDISTGKLRRDTLTKMHNLLRAETSVDDIEVSTATRSAPDRRRKPAPGMLLDAAKKWDIDRGASYMIGDRASDIECGVRAGCRTVFIDHGYTAEDPPVTQNATVADLKQAAEWICEQAEARGSDGRGRSQG